jgi:dTDP-4-amino-4,6-dideoxygalactose transaminase
MYHLRNYGARKQNQHEVIGCNSRLDELQAAVLNIKLRDLNSNNARRREIADCYRTALRNSTLRLPPAGVFHQYVVRHMRRDQFRAKLAARGVDTLIHYPTPPHLQRAMQHLGFREGDFPIAEAMSRECLSLPIGPELTQKQVEYVIEMVRECV